MTEEKQKDIEEKEPIKVSFSLPQITGGALAAATAAAIGSQLGVAGTIFGAAVASIVGGIAGTLYSAGIDRTHRKVSEAIVRGYDRVRGDESYDPQQVRTLVADGDAGDTKVLRPDADADAATRVLPGVGDSIFRSDDEPTRVDLRPVSPGGTDGRKRRVGQVMLLTVGAMFLVALTVVTVVELGLGRALGGGDGTTVSQVVQPAKASAKPSATPTPTTSTPTPSATPSATETPTATQTPTASQTPTPSATTTTSQAPTPATTGTGTSAPAAAIESP